MTIVLTFLAVLVLWYRSRGPRQRAIANRGLRWGFILGGIGFGLGCLYGIVIASAINPTESWGFAPLYGPIIVGPLLFTIGFALGVPAGMIREWFRQAASWYE